MSRKRKEGIFVHEGKREGRVATAIGMIENLLTSATETTGVHIHVKTDLHATAIEIIDVPTGIMMIDALPVTVTEMIDVIGMMIGETATTMTGMTGGTPVTMTGVHTHEKTDLPATMIEITGPVGMMVVNIPAMTDIRKDVNTPRAMSTRRLPEEILMEDVPTISVRHILRTGTVTTEMRENRGTEEKRQVRSLSVMIPLWRTNHARARQPGGLKNRNTLRRRKTDRCPAVCRDF